MKKTVLAMLAMVMLLSAGSMATETRTMVMGDNHMVLVDDYNMFTFPGRAFNYPNLALGEVGWYDDEMYQFGITWQFNEDNPWVLGTFISTEPEFGAYNYTGDNMAQFPYYGYDFGYYTVGATEELGGDYPRRFQVIYSRQLGGNNFGLSLDWVGQSWEYKNEDLNPKQSFNQYTVIAGLTEGTSGEWDVAAGFMFGGWTNEAPDGEKITEPNGFYDFGVTGRYFKTMSPKITYVPHIGITMGKRGYDEHEDYSGYGEETTCQQSRTAFDIGAGMNYTPGPDVLAVLDFGVQYYAMKDEFTVGTGDTEEYKETDFVLPYVKIGFEGEVFDWMDVRCGATAEIFSSADKTTYTYTDTEMESIWNTPHNETYFGMGFNFGRFHIDTYTDPEILLDGFNFISGSEDVEDMNWKVSILYEMF